MTLEREPEKVILTNGLEEEISLTFFKEQTERRNNMRIPCVKRAKDLVFQNLLLA